jgi:hypothetical protein
MSLTGRLSAGVQKHRLSIEGFDSVWRQTYCEGRLPARSVVQVHPGPPTLPSIYASIFNSAAHRIHPRKAVCQKFAKKSGQAHPDVRKIFRACFVAARAKRKTIELSVRSLCTTARSTDPEVRYKTHSPLKLEYTRQENGTSTDCAFFGRVDYFWIARHSDTDGKETIRSRWS